MILPHLQENIAVLRPGKWQYVVDDHSETILTTGTGHIMGCYS